MSIRKKEMLSVLQQAADLLTQCGWDDKADWFRERARRLDVLPIDSEEFRKELLNVKGILAGMGSFSDVAMYPKPDAPITRQQAREAQWDITTALGNSIDEFLHVGAVPTPKAVVDAESEKPKEDKDNSDE